MKPVLPLLFLLAALPAAATTPDDCLADLHALDAAARAISADGAGPPGSFVDLLPEPPVVEDGYCTIKESAIPLPMTGGMARVFTVGPIRWQAEWADATRPLPPARLSLRVDRAMQTISADPYDTSTFGPVLAYQSRLISEIAPYHLELDFAYDAQAQTAEIENFSVQRGNWDGLTLRTLVQDADLAGFFAAQDGGPPQLDKLALASLRHVDLSLTNFWQFEGMSMVWLNGIYPAMGDTPETALAASTALAKARIAEVPAALMGHDSRAALNAMLDSLPHPTGRLRLVLDAPDGIEPARLTTTAFLVAEPSWASFAPLLEGASLTATWTPIDPKPQLLPEDR